MNQTESISLMDFGSYSFLRQIMLNSSFNASNFTILESNSNGHSDVPPFLPLKLLPNIKILNLSKNNIERFNYSNIINGTPHLVELDLSFNKIRVLDDLVELGCLKELQKLNFIENPVSKSIIRVRLVEFLLFPKKHVPYNGVKVLTACYNHVSVESKKKDLFDDRQIVLTEDEKSLDREILKPKANKYDHTKTPIKMSMKECPVPRKTRFPMLKILNENIISVQDIQCILSGDNIEEILVKEKECIRKTKSQEKVETASEKKHNKYLDFVRRKNECILRESNNQSFLKFSTEKKRGSEKKEQELAKPIPKPFDVEYKDAEYNIGIEDFKEMTKKYLESKKIAEEEELMKKKQYIAKLRTMRKKQSSQKDETEMLENNSKVDQEIEREFRVKQKRERKPKMDLIMGEPWKVAASSESDVGEMVEDDLSQQSSQFYTKNTSVNSDSDDNHEAHYKSILNEKDTDISNVHPENLMKAVVDVKIKINRNRKRPKSRDIGARKEETGMTQDSKQKLDLSCIQSNPKVSERETEGFRTNNLENAPETITKEEENMKKRAIQESRSKKGRRFIVKIESTPNLSLPLYGDREKKIFREPQKIEENFIQKERISQNENFTLFSKGKNNRGDIIWDPNVVQNTSIMEDLFLSSKRCETQVECKDEASIVKYMLQGTETNRNSKEFEHSSADHDESKGETANTRGTDRIIEAKNSAKDSENKINEIPLFRIHLQQVNNVCEDGVPIIPNIKQKDEEATKDKTLCNFFQPTSKNQEFSKTETLGHKVENRTQSTDFQKPLHKPVGFDFDNYYGPKAPKSLNPIEIGSISGDSNASKLRRQRILQKKVEKQREKERNTFKLSNKLFLRQISSSLGRPCSDSTEISQTNIHDKSTQLSSKSNSTHFVSGHYKTPSTAKPVTDGYIALKNLYPQTSLNAKGLNISSIQFRSSNLSHPLEQQRQKTPEVKNISIPEVLNTITETTSDQKSLSYLERRKKAKSMTKESMKIIIKGPLENIQKSKIDQTKDFMIGYLLPKVEDGVSELQRRKIMTERGEKYQSLLETGKLLEKMDLLIQESNVLQERIQVHGGNTRHKTRENQNFRKELSFSDLTQLVRDYNKTKTLSAQDAKELKEVISMTYGNSTNKQSTLSVEKVESYSKELKDKMVKGDDWTVDSANYQLNKLDRYLELQDNLRITKEIRKIKAIPGYLDKIEKEEIQRVQSDAILAAHTMKMQKYYGDSHLKKYYKASLDLLGNIQNSTFEAKTNVNTVENNWAHKSKIEDKEKGDMRSSADQDKVSKYAEAFKEDIVKRKELKNRVEKYIKEGRKAIDEFLEREKHELEKIHDNKGTFRELVKLTWENKA